MAKKAKNTEQRRKVGAFIRARRKQLGMTVKELGRAIGYKSTNMLSQIERGKIAIPGAKIGALSKALKVKKKSLESFARGETSGIKVSGKSAVALEKEAVKALNRKIGEFIKQRREKLGLSQRFLSNALGYSSTTLSDIENGRVGVPPRIVFKLANLLELDSEKFFKFIYGAAKDIDTGVNMHLRRKAREREELSKSEEKLVLGFRKLSSKYKKRILDELEEYLVIERKR